MNVFVSGSSGLIGSEIVAFFDRRARRVVGIDNNMRADFFGRDGDTSWNLRRLIGTTKVFRHRGVGVERESEHRRRTGRGRRQHQPAGNRARHPIAGRAVRAEPDLKYSSASELSCFNRSISA